MTTKAVTYRLPEELLNKIEKAVEVLKKENPYGTVSKNSFVAGAIEKATEEILKEESPMKTSFGTVEFNNAAADGEVRKFNRVTGIKIGEANKRTGQHCIQLI